MGMSATAYVFYGYDLGNFEERDEVPNWYAEDGDWDGWDAHVAKALGWTGSAGLYEAIPKIDTGRYSPESDRNSPEYKIWIAAINEKSRLADSLGVALNSYGYLDSSETYLRLSIKESDRMATYECRGLGDLTVGADWDERLQRAVDILELGSLEQKPEWMVTSDYG